MLMLSNAAFDADLHTNLRSWWVMPSLWRNIMREVPAKPRQPTSNGKQCTCHCFCAHLVIRGGVLGFLALVCFLHVFFPWNSEFPNDDDSGSVWPYDQVSRRRVMAAATGKTSLPNRSDSTFQSQPPCRILTLFCCPPAFWSVPPPSDTKWMCLSSSLSPDS